MKINLYAVQDVKADRFNSPFPSQTHAEAMRTFGETCLNTKTLWNKYPEDFRLFLVGSFDDTTCQMESIPVPTFLAAATDYVQEKPGLNDAGKELISS